MKISLIDQNDLGQVTEVVECETLAEVAAVAASTAWAPGTFKENRRSRANFEQTDLLVLDIDDGCTLERAKEEFKDYEHAILLSKSHQKEKNGVVSDRFRVILRLKEPIREDKDFKATWSEAFKRWTFIDPACKDSSRFFYASPKAVRVKEVGETIARVEGPAEPVANLDLGPMPPGRKGELMKDTLEFLTFGAPAGTRHFRLVKAVADLREQGYQEPEVIDLLIAMSERGDWTQAGLNEKDLATISDVMSRPNELPFREREGETGPVSIQAASLLDEAIAYLSDKDKVKGDTTGIEGLDKLLGGGFRTGELTVLMAQAKTGKNALYHYLIYEMLCKGHKIAYASRELTPSSEVIPNLLTIATGTNLWKADIKPGLKDLAQALLTKWQLSFAPGYGYFPPNELERFMRAMAEDGYKHFFIDHLHYMLQGEDYESTAMLIKQIKTLTKELDVHVSLIVQPRSLRTEERLSLHTLRGGAAIGQALDNLLILERMRDERYVSKLTLEVARHRLAKPGSIYLQYDAETTMFEEVERETELHDDNQTQDRTWPQRPAGASRRDFRMSDA